MYHLKMNADCIVIIIVTIYHVVVWRAKNPIHSRRIFIICCRSQICISCDPLLVEYIHIAIVVSITHSFYFARSCEMKVGRA